jgi:hypothetical protein
MIDPITKKLWQDWIALAKVENARMLADPNSLLPATEERIREIAAAVVAEKDNAVGRIDQALIEMGYVAYVAWGDGNAAAVGMTEEAYLSGMPIPYDAVLVAEDGFYRLYRDNFLAS